MTNNMAERIIAFICCLLCAIPLLIISVYNKDSKDPISFWSGDTSLKKKLKNVRDYNKEMAQLYQKCAFVFLVTGIAFIIYPIAGIILLCFDCTIGIYIVYRKYKKILKIYSE